jgi:hypothetical protein|nr:MAG TPA: hypothetical protein [Crassvirales sp.]
MNDIEILKAALNSSIRTIASNLGVPYFAPMAIYGANNMLNKPKYKIMLDALTDGNGNIDIESLSNVLKDTIRSMPNKPTLLGISLGTEDIDLLKREFLNIRSKNI